MTERDDTRFMTLALRAARRGRTSPNPHVGAVVVKGSEVLAVGWHRRAGLPHAEVEALRKAGDAARGATVYVTLEPCNHYGRTPPCTDALLAAGVAEVVVGHLDPNPKVRGSLRKLRAAGVRVRAGVCEAECRALIADFEKLVTTGMPYVTLKAAVTLDGKMATRTGDSKWITGERARRRAHQLRAQHDAILVGAGTVRADDPELTVRHVRGPDPIRVVLDTRLETPPGARMLTSGSMAPTWIFHSGAAPAERAGPLRAAGAELIEVRDATTTATAAAARADQVSIEAVLRALGERGVMRLLVEGGPTVHGTLLDAGLADAAAIFVAPRFLADEAARSFAPAGPTLTIEESWSLVDAQVRRLGPDVLFEGRLRKGGG